MSSVHVGMVMVFTSYEDATVFKGGRVLQRNISCRESGGYTIFLLVSLAHASSMLIG